MYKIGSRLNYQKPGLYGQCSDASFLTFLDNDELSSCSFHRQKMTEEFCTKKLSIAHIFNMKINPDGKEGTTPLSMTIGKAKKYNY